jgi:branched-chain amino acid transport system substrate-binding protein
MRAFLRVLLVASLCAAVAACGDDGSSADKGTTTTDPGSSQGGKTATGEPLRIGHLNLQEFVPEARLGAQVAVDYINSELNGVNGRPIEYVTCDSDPSPEKTIDCANQLVESGVDLVQVGIDLNLDAAMPIFEAAGIPVTGHVALSPQVRRSEHAVFFGASFFSGAAAPLQHLADEGLDSVTYLLAEQPTSHELVDRGVKPAADTLDLDYRTVFYDSANPDWSVLVATAMADHPDAIGSPVATEPECIGFIGALRSAGYDGEIIAGQCTQFIEALGPAAAAGVLTISDRWRPDDIESAPKAKQADIQTYIDAMKADGKGDQVNGFSFFYFATTVDMARALDGVTGEYDGASMLAAMRAVHDADGFMGPKISCDGSLVPDESQCSTGWLTYEVTESGTMRALDKDFVDVSGLLAG